MVRIAAAMATLVLLLSACGGAAKDTGLPTGSPTPEPEKGAVVFVRDNFFDARQTTIKVGDQVHWHFVGSAPHNVKFVKLPINSNPNCSPGNTGACGTAGEEFTQSFTKPGTYLFYCVIHGAAVDDPVPHSRMDGYIIVK
ncbi:MAG: cupredoxin domain-containing protein [Actinomycetota bacterium]